MKMERIARRARLLAGLTTTLMIAVPLIVLAVLAIGGIDAQALRQTYNISVMPDDPGTGPIFVWLAVEAVRLALFLWVLWCVRGWMIACARAQVFAGATARHVQRIGTGLILLAVAHVVGNTIIVAALTWNNPAGERTLAVGFGSTEVLLMLAAGLVTLFGWIQAEAARISAENEGFV